LQASKNRNNDARRDVLPDIHLEPGEWLIREDEKPRFFVVLAGELEMIKDIVGQRRTLDRYVTGDFQVLDLRSKNRRLRSGT
jgi:CRP-like cAMP-binding protein